MNKIFSTLLFCVIMNSCNTQNRVSLDELTLNENKQDLFQNKKTILETREINTTLPLLYTNDVDLYKYGNVKFIKSDENDIVLSKVGVLLENSSDKKIVGVVVTVEDTETSDSFLKEIIKINGTPEILMPIPKENDENQLLGYSAYLWRLKDSHSIVLTQSYEYTDGKRNIASLAYIVSDNIKVTNPNQNEHVIDRLIKTYKQ